MLDQADEQDKRRLKTNYQTIDEELAHIKG
jgi:hypothetical protein